ncbi:MAG: hypothetical protein WBE89_09225 [Methyloceanibacter sp.]
MATAEAESADTPLTQPTASGLSKNVEAVVLSLEKRGVMITEHGVEFTGKPKRR